MIDYYKEAFKFLDRHGWKEDIMNPSYYTHDCFPEVEQIKDGEEAITLCMQLYGVAWEHYLEIIECRK